ncbi:MAG: ClpX C4-type zinc finger protein [Actinomycetota bacterium]
MELLDKGRDKLHCSFCGRAGSEGQALVAGPGIYICDKCARKAVSLAEGSKPNR